jgi:hypothetical protein
MGSPAIASIVARFVFWALLLSGLVMSELRVGVAIGFVVLWLLS